MNRKQRRATLSDQHARVKALPAALTQVPREQWPAMPPGPEPKIVWWSRAFLVQLYDEGDLNPGVHVYRLSINRTRVATSYSWRENITWDELQDVKRQCGFSNVYAIEVYPRDQDMVNVSNMRHLWLLSIPLRVGWFNSAPPAHQAAQGGVPAGEPVSEDLEASKT